MSLRGISGALLLTLVIELFLLSPGCAAGSKRSEPVPVSIAREEAVRQGWKKVRIDYYAFRKGFWEVHVYRLPRTLSGRDAWIKISSEGEVIDFSVNTR